MVWWPFGAGLCRLGRCCWATGVNLTPPGPGSFTAGAGLVPLRWADVAGPEPDAAGVNLTPPGPGSFTATFLCITVMPLSETVPSSGPPSSETVPSSGTGFEPPLWSGSAWDASAAAGGLGVGRRWGRSGVPGPNRVYRHVLRSLRIRTNCEKTDLRMRLSAAVAPVAVLGFSVLAEGLGLAAVLRDVDDVPALAGLDVDDAAEAEPLALGPSRSPLGRCGWRCRGSHGSSSPLGSRCSRVRQSPPLGTMWIELLRRSRCGNLQSRLNLQFVDGGSVVLHADLRHHLGSARVSERDEKEETTDVVYWISAS